MSNNPNRRLMNDISHGVKKVENLLSKKEYNLSIITARQTMEYMTKYLCDKFNIPLTASSLENIDNLSQRNILSERSKSNFHTIRTIGNMAVHEGYENPSDAARVHSALIQELNLFKNGYYNRKTSLSRNDIIRLLSPIVLIILLAVVILILKNCSGDKSLNKNILEKPAVNSVDIQKPDANETTNEITVVEEEQAPPTLTTYITKSNLNIRSSPSLEGDKIATLPKGSEIQFVKDYNNDWAVIEYNGSHSYVSKKYIQPK